LIKLASIYIFSNAAMQVMQKLTVLLCTHDDQGFCKILTWWLVLYAEHKLFKKVKANLGTNRPQRCQRTEKNENKSREKLAHCMATWKWWIIL